MWSDCFCDLFVRKKRDHFNISVLLESSEIKWKANIWMLSLVFGFSDKDSEINKTWVNSYVFLLDCLKNFSNGAQVYWDEKVLDKNEWSQYQLIYFDINENFGRYTYQQLNFWTIFSPHHLKTQWMFCALNFILIYLMQIVCRCFCPCYHEALCLGISRSFNWTCTHLNRSQCICKILSQVIKPSKQTRANLKQENFRRLWCNEVGPSRFGNKEICLWLYRWGWRGWKGKDERSRRAGCWGHGLELWNLRPAISCVCAERCVSHTGATDPGSLSS